MDPKMVPKVLTILQKGVLEAAMVGVEPPGRLRRASLESRSDPDTLPGTPRVPFWIKFDPFGID